MKKINNVLHLITAIFEGKTIFYKDPIEDNRIIEFDFLKLEEPTLLNSKNFIFEIEYGCNGTIDDFIKLNNFISFLQTQNTWVTKEGKEHVFPTLRDLYYEENTNIPI